MRLATIQKLGGFALIAGAILFATYSVLFLSLFPAGEIHKDFSRIVLSPPWIGVAAIAFAGVVLMVFGFAAVYSRLHQGAGALGLVGFVFIEVAYLLQACKVTWEIFLYPIIAGNPSSATLLRDGILRDHPLVHAFKAGASATIFLGIHGPAVRILAQGFSTKLSGLSWPFSWFARDGLAKAGHLPPQDKLARASPNSRIDIYMSLSYSDRR